MNRFRLHRETIILFAGDLIAALLFVYIGQRDHDLVDVVNPLWGVVKTSAFFAVPWVCAVLALKAWPRSDSGIKPFLVASFNAWLVAAPLGVLVRGYALGRAVIPSVFLVATYIFGGLFLLGWRVLFATLWARARRSKAAEA